MKFTGNSKKYFIAIAVVAALLSVYGFLSLSGNQVNNVDAWGSTCGSCDDGGGDFPGQQDDGENNPPNVPSPYCKISVNASSITAGQSATLKWSTFNANLAELNQGIGFVSVGQDRTRSISPTKDTTYTMTVSSATGAAKCSVKVTVKAAPPAPAPLPSCVISASPTTINKGSSSTLKWTTTNATEASINQSIGAVAIGSNKTRSVSPTATVTYTMTVKNKDGKTANCNTKVTVNVPPAPAPLPSCVISINPTKVYSGEYATLKWTTTNATEASVNQGVGSVAIGANKTLQVNRHSPTTYGYTMTVKNKDGKQATCTTQLIVIEKPTPAPLPSCVINANPSTINKGSSSTLTWTTTNATEATINQSIGAVAVGSNKTRSVSPTATITYTMTVKNKDGKSANCNTTVTVKTPPPAHLPSCDISANPSTIYKGSASTLTWTTYNATEATINQGIGAVAIGSNKTRSVSPTATITYTMTVKNKDGKSANCNTTVTVKNKPTPTPLPSCVISASPSTIYKGDSATLTWTTDDATEASLNQGIGSVSIGTNRTRSVSPNNTTTYTMTVKNKDGDSDNCHTTITVKDKPTHPTLLSCSDVDFRASDTNVDEGDRITLSWDWNSKVDSASINHGIGNVSNNDSKEVRIDDDITYTITIKNNHDSRQCSISINAKEDGGGGGGGGGPLLPRCELEVSDRKVRSGESVELSWETDYATRVVIEDDRDNELLDTDNRSDRDEFDGDLTVRPTRDTTYTLTATRGSSKRTCRAEVEITDSKVTVLEVRDQQPLVAGISLTQVPYTGFEAGPMLTFIFYALLTLWALFVAYVLIIRRDSILGFSLPGSFGNTAYADASVEVSSPFVSSPAASYVEAVAEAVPANLPASTIPAPVFGYSSLVRNEDVEENQEFTDKDVEMNALENYAHTKKALLSSDAMRFLAHAGHNQEAREHRLDLVIKTARERFPTEDGWVIINLSRMESILGELEETAQEALVADVTPINHGSLAEAITSGNVIAAFEMISHRPMIALADAAADLDAVYRSRKGEAVNVSDLLLNQTVRLTDEQLAAMIAALTSAIDGTYQNEAEAVKMAIMKAIKATSH